MNILRFEAIGVYGYLDFNIKFNQDKNFLVGGNGSGKTTALKLMNALINPSFRDLLTISFESCSLVVENNSNIIIIYASSDGKNIKFGVSSCKNEINLPLQSSQEIDLFMRKDERLNKLIEGLTRKYITHPVIKEISKLNSPLFLGLDRRTDLSDTEKEYFHERELWLNVNKKKHDRGRILVGGALGASLMEIEMLVQNAYKDIRELEVEQSHMLRNQILLSSFKYSSFNDSSIISDSLSWKQKKGLLMRKAEIKESVSNIVGLDSSISDEVDDFFDNLGNLLKSLTETNHTAQLEWLLNKAQIDRMSDIVDIIDIHKSKIDHYYRPINDFLSIVNLFYGDSNKFVDIDAVGQLSVFRPDYTECTIEGLSSGERQLLIILAHSFFNKNNIFIIDEPELSLHLKWQEKFADVIFSINPNSQFILATHSPEIIAGNKNKAVGCR